MPKNIYEDTENKTIEEFELTVPSNRTLKLENFKGTILIHGWDNEKVKINAVIHNNVMIGGETISNDASAEVYTETNENTGISVTTKINNANFDFSSTGSGFFENIINWVNKKISSALSGAVDYDIWVPKDFKVIADNKSGGYYLSDFIGTARLNTSNGHIEVDNVIGDVNLLTYNGKIVVTDLNGNLTADSYNGQIIVAGSILVNARIKSMNGALMFQFKPSIDGNYILKTMNGRIMIGLPPDSSIELSCKTLSGKIHNKVSNEENIKSEKNNLIILGTGDAKLSATTMSGSIYVVDYDEFTEEQDNYDKIEDEDKKIRIKIDVPKDSEEYKEIKEDITEALNKINNDIKELLFSSSLETDGKSGELNEIIDKFTSLKKDFINIINEPNFADLSKEDKSKINEKYETQIKSLEKELQNKVSNFNSEMKGVDEKVAEKINKITESIDAFSKKLKELPSLVNIDNEMKKLRKPGRPLKTGKKESYSEETKLILEMLKEGKISATEAEALLNAIKNR